jgi:hypothetical protein
MSNLKAYVIQDDAGGTVSELVFAESPNKARALYRYSLWLGDCDYRDIKARRVPKADPYAHLAKGGLVEFSLEKYWLFRDILGFHEIDRDTCLSCGLSDYERPEYELCTACDHCPQCGCQCEMESVA